MKRAFTQKVGSVPSCASNNEGVNALPSESNPQTLQPELTRRVKTSATTIGLAIAMAASGMLLSQKHQKVMAAEEFGVAKATEVSPNLENSQPNQDSPTENGFATSEKSITDGESTHVSRSELAKVDEVAVPTAEVQQPTPVITEADGSGSAIEIGSATSEEKPKSASNVADVDKADSATSLAARNDEQPVETVPQLSALEDAPKVIYQVKSGDTLQTIAETYDTSVTQLAKLNSLDTKAPLETDRGLIVPESQSSARSEAPTAEEAYPQAELPETDYIPSDSLTQEQKPNELQAEIETLQQGTQVKTLVAQATPLSSVPIAVPEPDAVATASPLAQEVPDSAPKEQLELAAGGAIEIPVPKPENMTVSAAKVEIRSSKARQSRKIETQTPEAAPVSTGQADSLVLEAGAIEIPVPKPATNFVPNRSQTGRLATAPLGANDYNSDIPASSSQEDLKERFLNPGANVTYGWPVNGVITSGFGMRWGRLHAGIDFGVPTGTPVYAAAPGIVKRSGWVGGYGNLVEIIHPDGSVTRYGHNSQLMMQAGQEVRQGEVIALSGNTGRSTGPHVHFEIRPDGKQAVNPMPLLPRRA